ncbi:MAG: cytochrome bc1 complex diheme cytochrome c subunit [Actinomycetota bacterium]
MPLLSRALLIAGLVAGISLAGPSAEERSALAQQDLVEEGRTLFETSCASCHGPDGSGGEFGPSLEDAGAAAADFQLRTGRMPLADPDAQAARNEPLFTPGQIEALVAFVDSLGNGPDIPDVDLEGADLAVGQFVFQSNCAPCHGSTGNGGAAGSRALAPGLYRSEPLDVAEAVITGPGQMPKFGFDDAERNDLVAYITFLQRQSPPGGASLGGVGPVPEGFAAWLIGTAALTLICFVLGRKRLRGGRP